MKTGTTTIFAHALREYRGQIIGWGLGLIALGALTVPSYEMVAKNSEPLAQLVANLPEAMTAFFGDMSQAINPRGFLTVKYYSFLPLMLGILTVFLGTGMLSRDEQSGLLDLVLAHPIRRWQVYVGRLLAATLTSALIVLLAWLGLLLGAVLYPIPVAALDLLWPLLSALAVILVFQCVALVLSQILPSRRLASFVAISLVFASFFITGLAHMNPKLDPVAALSPITYYQSGAAMDGLDLGALAGLLVVATSLAGMGYVVFERRDIRLSGEGSWDVLRRLVRWR